MIDPHDKDTLDAFGHHQEVQPVKRGRGRPATATDSVRREQNRIRQARFKQARRQQQAAMKFLSELLSNVTKGTNRSNRQTIVEAMQFLSGAGEDLECDVELESGQSRKISFSSLAAAINETDRIYTIR